MHHSELVGRPVQVLRIKPELILDLLRDLEDRRISVPTTYRGKNDLTGARVIGCREVNGMICLYLEKESWPVIDSTNMPFVRHFYVQTGCEICLTADFPPLPEAAGIATRH
jgi:hypothetical protein